MMSDISEGLEATADVREEVQMENLHLFTREMADIAQVNTPYAAKEFEDSVESMLIRLDEYGTLVDLIRSDSNHCITGTLPQIHAKADEMSQIFDKIDGLEKFVFHVGRNLDAMETAVDKAESELGQMTSLKKSFFSKFSTKSALERKPEPRLKFESPGVFCTNDWLDSSSQRFDHASKE